MENTITKRISKELVFGFQAVDGYLTYSVLQRSSFAREVGPISQNILAQNPEALLYFKLLITPILIIALGKITNDWIIRREDKDFELFVERLINLLWILVVINNVVYFVRS